MLPYNFERDNIPESYQKLTWEDFRERTQRDYGPPQVSNGPLVPFYDLERDADYMLGLTYF